MKQLIMGFLCISSLLQPAAGGAYAQASLNPVHRPHNTDQVEQGDVTTPVLSPKQSKDKDVLAICKMLTAQVREWNNGNIDGYMHGYWQSDSLLFIGSKGPRHGYDSTLRRYKEAYPDADHMGHLRSAITSIQRLSGDYYFVVGRWALKRNAGDVDGSYTLLLKKINNEWVIICDHSS